MADVRSLLKAERASRRINHSQASYSASGQLFCSVCQLHIKSEGLWEPHTKSFQHTKQLQRARDAKQARHAEDATLAGKKRKVIGGGDEGHRKRAKPEEANGLPAGFFDGVAVEANPQSVQSPEEEPRERLDGNSVDGEATHGEITQPAEPLPPPPSDPSIPQPPATQDTIDDEEWAAFQRDVANPPPEQTAISVLNAAATIEAAPMSAAELAAQAREEQSTQRGRREAEAEAEKEDAARHMEEEFDELEALEERVRKLHEKREALRTSSHGQGYNMTAAEVLPVLSTDAQDTGDEDDEEDDDWEDDWRIRSR